MSCTRVGLCGLPEREEWRRKEAAPQPAGLWADLNIHITEEDIAEARREMWGNFPRDIKLMSAVLDTHTVLWYLLENSSELSAVARKQLKMPSIRSPCTCFRYIAS